MAEEAKTETVEKKTCFVACPIDKDGSEIRNRTNAVIKCLIKPVLGPLNFIVLPAHEIAGPGDIPIDVVTHLVEDELVIADLTKANANVMYELGIRHSAGQPVLTICNEKETLPFDICHNRTIFYDSTSWDGLEEAKKQLRESVDAVIAEPRKMLSSPVRQALGERILCSMPKEGEVTWGDQLREVVNVVLALRDDIRKPRDLFPTGGTAHATDPANQGMIRHVEHIVDLHYSHAPTDGTWWTLAEDDIFLKGRAMGWTQFQMRLAEHTARERRKALIKKEAAKADDAALDT